MACLSARNDASLRAGLSNTIFKVIYICRVSVTGLDGSMLCEQVPDELRTSDTQSSSSPTLCSDH